MKILLWLLLFCCHAVAMNETSGDTKSSHAVPVMTLALDGVKVYGHQYFGTLDDKAPLILLFHQASSNGRGEYADIIPWLNTSGYRVLAWDLRSGGSRFGSENNTVKALNPDIKYSYCEVSPDLQAALDYVVKQNLAAKVIVWGSSYSAALVFKLAAENKHKVSAVASFSPASGGPMSACRAKMWLDQVTQPIIVFRPDSEMQRTSSIEQRSLFIGAGATFHVIENGTHGSSTLVDARTENNMQEARLTMENWLNSLSSMNTNFSK
ncbi:MAG: alpha/beta hydrolase [Marinicella sp.]